MMSLTNKHMAPNADCPRGFNTEERLMQSFANLKIRTKPALSFVVQAAALLLAGMTQEYVSMVISVAADGMRKVAESATLAKREITAAIRNIQEQTIEAATSMKRSDSEARGAAKLTDIAGDFLKNVTDNTHNVLDLIMLVAATTRKQWAMAGQISEDVEVTSDVLRRSGGRHSTLGTISRKPEGAC